MIMIIITLVGLLGLLRLAPGRAAEGLDLDLSGHVILSLSPSLSLYIYIYIYICMYIHTYIHTYMSIYLSIYLSDLEGLHGVPEVRDAQDPQVAGQWVVDVLVALQVVVVLRRHPHPQSAQVRAYDDRA